MPALASLAKLIVKSDSVCPVSGSQGSRLRGWPRGFRSSAFVLGARLNNTRLPGPCPGLFRLRRHLHILHIFGVREGFRGRPAAFPVLASLYIEGLWRKTHELEMERLALRRPSYPFSARRSRPSKAGAGRGGGCSSPHEQWRRAATTEEAGNGALPKIRADRAADGRNPWIG